MSDRTTTSTSAQAQTPAVYTKLADVPLYQQATPEEQRLLEQDLASVVQGDGLPLAEYFEGLATWGGTAADYLAEQGVTPAQPVLEAVVQAQAAVATEQAAEQEAKAREEAAGTLKAVVKAYRRGEKAYRAGLLESGKLCDHYLHQRMAVGDKRAAAVQAVEGALAQWASSTVDLNRLIACYQAYRLLAEEPGVTEEVPYGHYRDCWMQVVLRVQKDTPQEHWVLLPGVEQQARELFAKAVQDSLSKEAVLERVKALQRQYMAAQAEEAKAKEA